MSEEKKEPVKISIFKNKPTPTVQPRNPENASASTNSGHSSDSNSGGNTGITTPVTQSRSATPDPVSSSSANAVSHTHPSQNLQTHSSSDAPSQSPQAQQQQQQSLPSQALQSQYVPAQHALQSESDSSKQLDDQSQSVPNLHHQHQKPPQPQPQPRSHSQPHSESDTSDFSSSSSMDPTSPYKRTETRGRKKSTKKSKESGSALNPMGDLFSKAAFEARQNPAQALTGRQNVASIAGPLQGLVSAANSYAEGPLFSSAASSGALHSANSSSPPKSETGAASSIPTTKGRRSSGSTAKATKGAKGAKKATPAAATSALPIINSKEQLIKEKRAQARLLQIVPVHGAQCGDLTMCTLDPKERLFSTEPVYKCSVCDKTFHLCCVAHQYFGLDEGFEPSDIGVWDTKAPVPKPKGAKPKAAKPKKGAEPPDEAPAPQVPPKRVWLCPSCQIEDIVWVKIEKRDWPAKVVYLLELEPKTRALLGKPKDLLVQFFGDHKYSWVRYGEVKLARDFVLNESETNNKTKGQKLWEKAVKEAQTWVEKQKKVLQNPESVFDKEWIEQTEKDVVLKQANMANHLNIGTWEQERENEARYMGFLSVGTQPVKPKQVVNDSLGNPIFGFQQHPTPAPNFTAPAPPPPVSTATTTKDKKAESFTPSKKANNYVNNNNNNNNNNTKNKAIPMQPPARLDESSDASQQTPSDIDEEILRIQRELAQIQNMKNPAREGEPPLKGRAVEKEGQKVKVDE